MSKYGGYPEENYPICLEGKVFGNAVEAAKMLTLFSTGTEKEIRITKSWMSSPIVTSLLILPAIELPSGKVFQLTSVHGFEPVPIDKLKNRGRLRKLIYAEPGAIVLRTHLYYN